MIHPSALDWQPRLLCQGGTGLGRALTMKQDPWASSQLGAWSPLGFSVGSPFTSTIGRTPQYSSPAA